MCRYERVISKIGYCNVGGEMAGKSAGGKEEGVGLYRRTHFDNTQAVLAENDASAGRECVKGYKIRGGAIRVCRRVLRFFKVILFC